MFKNKFLRLFFIEEVQDNINENLCLKINF